MTERENFIQVLRREKPKWTPCFYDAYQPMASSLINNTGEFMKGGTDMFGVTWICTADTGYQVIPDPNVCLFDDVNNWRDYVRFPDMDAWDWETAAAKDLAGINREEKMLAVFGMEGNFNRLQSMMGTCEALMAMITDTDAVYDFFDAYTDFKIRTIEKYAKYYKPDIYVNADDVASSTGLFFSPALYKELIKPFEIRLGRAAIDNGMIVEHHVCGLVEQIIPDIIETGAAIWQTAQSTNDLVKIKQEYGDKLLIHGGWDSYGPHNLDTATEEEVRGEVRRCIDTYGRDGVFALFPVIIGDPKDGIMQRLREWASDECRKYSEQLFS